MDQVDISTEKVIEGSGGGLIVDLTGCGYLDSAGIRLLFDAARRSSHRRQELRVVVPDDAPVLRPITLTGLALPSRGGSHLALRFRGDG